MSGELAKKMGEVLRIAVNRSYELGLEDGSESAVFELRRALAEIALVASDGHLQSPGYGGLPLDWRPRHEAMDVEEWCAARADLALEGSRIELFRHLQDEI